MCDSGIIIGMKSKENKYKRIISKLLNKEDLDEEEKDFLRKEGILQ